MSSLTDIQEMYKSRTPSGKHQLSRMVDIGAANLRKLILVVGDSGSGKTEILNRLTKEGRGRYILNRVVTVTTRPRRPNEPENAYHFVQKDEFFRLQKAGLFIETSSTGEHLYGTMASHFLTAMPHTSVQGAAVAVVDMAGVENLLGIRREAIDTYLRAGFMGAIGDRSFLFDMHVLVVETPVEISAKRILTRAGLSSHVAEDCANRILDLVADDSSPLELATEVNRLCWASTCGVGPGEQGMVWVKPVFEPRNVQVDVNYSVLSNEHDGPYAMEKLADEAFSLLERDFFVPVEDRQSQFREWQKELKKVQAEEKAKSSAEKKRKRKSES